MSISPARTVAFDILLRVEQQGAFASELLHSDRTKGLSPMDRGLCTELVMGTLRWQSKIDSRIAIYAKKAKLDPEVRLALRLGTYQMGYLSHIPTHAAINESVELVKRAHKRSATGFVNAVLRKMMEVEWLHAPLADTASAHEIANAYAHPVWLVEKWIREYSSMTAQKICEFDQHVPHAALRFNQPEVEQELIATGIQLEPGALLTSARRAVSGNVTSTQAFREKRVVIQDEASQLVAMLVGGGERILDCCAAPGSKTAAIALRNPRSRIVAAELHPHRAKLLRERVANENVEVVTSSATALPYGAEFNRVLVDVPCSGTGTLAHNPEIKWKLHDRDLVDLRDRQLQILKSAIKYVAPDGMLIYSTCSLETEENESVVEEVLRALPDFKLVECGEVLRALQQNGELAWKDTESLVSGPYLRTIPGIHPCEGFFSAIIQKNSNYQ